MCLLGDPSRLEAVVVIDQSDMKYVRKGQHVRIQLDEAPGTILKGTISEIARTDLKILPRELAAERVLPARIDQHGRPHPVQTSYHARVSLEDPPKHLLTGARGWARIRCDPQSLAQQAYHWLGRTFRFEL